MVAPIFKSEHFSNNSFIKKLKRYDDKIPPCLTPSVQIIGSLNLLSYFTIIFDFL
jgi:hypothetical protein